MSYSAVVGMGPAQSMDEKRAPALPEIEHTESLAATSLVDVDTGSVRTVPSHYESQPVQTQTEASRLEREADGKEARASAESKGSKQSIKSTKDAAKVKFERMVDDLEANADDPIYLGNVLAVVALSAGLGLGAYRKYVAGELTWKLVGIWSGVVGTLAVVDVYFSRFFFRSFSRAS